MNDVILIDADSHMSEPLDWLDQVDSALAREVASRSDVPIAEQLLGELIEAIPEQLRPPLESWMPPAQLAVFDMLSAKPTNAEREAALKQAGLEAIFAPPGGRGGQDRLRFCDEHGIDVQVCLPTLGIPLVNAARRVDAELGFRVARAYNDWVSAACAGSDGRLVPVAQILLDDVGKAEAELRRARDLGALSWIMPLNPVASRTLGHRAYDRLWQTSLDLGMVPNLHQGMGWAPFDPAWGLNDEGKLDARRVLSLTGMLIPLTAQLALSSMIWGGVFDRFPDLVVMCQEFGMGWADEWSDRIGPTSRQGSPNFAGFFEWPHKGTPDDIIRRHIRFTPLRGQRVDVTIRQFGDDVMLYASDYPHPEGIQVDWQFYERQLSSEDDATRRKFFGENAAKLFGLDIDALKSARTRRLAA